MGLLSGGSREVPGWRVFGGAAVWVGFGTPALHPPRDQQPEDAPDICISGIPEGGERRFILSS